MQNSKLATIDYINWENEIDLVRSMTLSLIAGLSKQQIFDEEDLEIISRKLHQEIKTIFDFENILKQEIGILFQLFDDYEVVIEENSIIEDYYNRIIILFKYCVLLVKYFSRIIF